MKSIKFPKFKMPKWFTWHLFPSKDSQILSIYELLFFVVCLSLCFWTYSKVNSITTHSYVVEAECLNAKDVWRSFDRQALPSAKIEFLLPMTETFEGSAYSSVTFQSVKSSEEQKERLIHSDFRNVDQNKRDSLIEEFYKYFKKGDKESSNSMYYIKTTHSLNKKLLFTPKLNLDEDSIGEGSWKGKYIIKQRCTDTDYSQEIFNLISSSGFIINTWNFSEKGGFSMSNPGWFAGFDFSQAYYDIKLQSTTIDSMTLEINFVGATDFSRMVPEPDTITMNSIKFTHAHKIRLIREKGLQFHATFKDMVNRQTIRIFFLTAIMCSLFSFLLIFTIIGIFKVFAEIKIKN